MASLWVELKIIFEADLKVANRKS